MFESIEKLLLEGCVRFQGVCVKTGKNASENRNERRKLCAFIRTREIGSLQTGKCYIVLQF